ncbi:transposase [Enterococcus sp. LJL99]
MGCQWRMLPSDFPPHKIVWSFYKGVRKKGIWEEVIMELVEND